MLNTISGLLGAAGAAVVGDYESIATVSVTTATPSITFSSIPSTYKHLQLRAHIMSTAGASGIYGQGRVGNGSVDSGSNYSDHYLAGNGAGTGAGSGSGSYFRAFGYLSGSQNNAHPTALVMDLLDYANTNAYKTFRQLYGADSNGVGEIALGSASWRSTSAINALTIFAFSQGSASNFGQYSSFALYGIKG